MDTYHRVSAAVAPKRAKLRRTEAILAAADAQLHEKQATLRVRSWSLICITTPVAEICQEVRSSMLSAGCQVTLGPCRAWRSEWRLCSCS